MRTEELLLLSFGAYAAYELWRGRYKAVASAALYLVLAYAAAEALAALAARLPPPPDFTAAASAGPGILALGAIGAIADSISFSWSPAASYFLEVASWAYRPAKAAVAFLNLAMAVEALYTALYVAAQYAPLMASTALLFIWRARRGGGALLMLAFSIAFAAWFLAPLARGLAFAFSGPPCAPVEVLINGSGPPGGFWLITSQGPVYINGSGYGIFYACGLKASEAMWLWMEVNYSYSYSLRALAAGNYSAVLYVLYANASLPLYNETPVQPIMCGGAACGAHVGGVQVGPYDFALANSSMWLLAENFTYSVLPRGENASCSLQIYNATPRMIPSPAPPPGPMPYPPPWGYEEYRGWIIRAEAVNATCVIHAVPGPPWGGGTFAYTEALQFAKSAYGQPPPFDIFGALVDDPNAVVGIALASMAAGIPMGALTGMWVARAASTIVSVMSRLIAVIGDVLRDLLGPYLYRLLSRRKD